MSIWALCFGGVSFNVFTCIASLTSCIHPAPCPSCFLWHVFSYSWFLHSVVTKRCVINLLLPHASIVYTLGYRTACYRSERLFSLQDVHLSIHRVNKKSCLIYRINKYICFSVYFSLPSILLFTSFFFFLPFPPLPSPFLPLYPPLPFPPSPISFPPPFSLFSLPFPHSSSSLPSPLPSPLLSPFLPPFLHSANTQKMAQVKSSDQALQHSWDSHNHLAATYHRSMLIPVSVQVCMNYIWEYKSTDSGILCFQFITGCLVVCYQSYNIFVQLKWYFKRF